MRHRGDTAGVVDFGSRDIRVLIGRQDSDGAIHIIGHGTAPAHGCVSQGVTQDRGAAHVALKRALTAAEKEAGTRVRSLFCGVTGKKVETFIREGKVEVGNDVVDQSHMAEARDIASRDVLAPGTRILSSITAQEWYVDDLRVLDPLGIRGQILKTRVHFARLPSVIEDNLVTCIESQGRELEDLVFLPLASALGCLTPEDMELGVAMIDLGRSMTSLAVYRDFRVLTTHCFEWGGYHMTRDVAAGLQVSFEEADDLILEYGIPQALIEEEFHQDEENDEDGERGARQQDDRPSRVKLRTAVAGTPSIIDRAELDVIIFERAKELIVKARQHLHARGLTKHLVRGVVLTGGAAAVKNYTALVEAVFQVPCRVGMPVAMEFHTQAARAPEFSAAAGIVRHAFEYRAAARNGRVEARGPMVSWVRRLTRFLKRYFF